MKINLTFLLVFLSLIVKVSAQNTFKTGTGDISFPGELVYSGTELNMEREIVWVKGYIAIESDSVSFTKIVYGEDKNTANYCYHYVSSLKDVFIYEGVETLDDPSRPPAVHLFSIKGKPKDNKFTKAVYCREYNKDYVGVVQKHEDYVMLFIYNDRKSADDFYALLQKLLGN